MLLQALRVEIEMKNPNLQVTFLVQKGVATRSHTKKKCGNAVPTRSHPTTPLRLTRLNTDDCEKLCSSIIVQYKITYSVRLFL